MKINKIRMAYSLPVLILLSCLSAQNDLSIIYLKDDGMIQGKIIENVSGDYLRLRVDKKPVRTIHYKDIDYILFNKIIENYPINRGVKSLRYNAMFSEIDKLEFSRKRDAMIADIKNKGFERTYILDAFRQVPMELFCPLSMLPYVYSDNPIVIEYDESISQPFISAVLIALVDIVPGDKVLELKTASGYQTALFCEMGAEVYSIETHQKLSEITKERLNIGNYSESVHLKVGNVRKGWSDEAPFKAIIATAAFRNIPETVTEQLEIGGRFLLPVGNTLKQTLVIIERVSKDEYVKKETMQVRFAMMPGE